MTEPKGTIVLISPYWKEQHRWMVSSYKLADLWQRIGYKVVVVCMGSENSVRSDSPTLTVHTRKDLFLPDPWNYGISFGFAGYVRRVIKQEQPQIIVVNKILFWSSLSLLSLRLRGKKVILLTDALVGMTWWPRGTLPKIGAAIYAWTLGWLIMKMATKIVFFHPQPDALLKKLGVRKKSSVIPTGIDEKSYGSQNSEFRIQNSATITYVGRLESVKGVDDYLAAVVPLRTEFPELKIQVVGWYPSTSSGQVLHPLVRAYEKEVHFTGLREDIPAVLGATDIFVLPSYSEGLSNALMEAMASGCACIASDVGGNSFLINNGVSGFLFPAGDREALRSHVRRLLQDPHKARDLGIEARKRIESVFSWDIVGKKYSVLFNSILSS